MPVIAIKDVPAVLESIREEMVPEFRWIEAGRNLTACDNAVNEAEPKNSVVKSVQRRGLLETPEMEDVRRRYPKCLKAMNLMDKTEGWKFYKQGSTGTKVFSKYDEEGHFWIKIDGIFKGTPTTCTR